MARSLVPFSLLSVDPPDSSEVDTPSVLPLCDSRPHLIGGHGDLVWAGGSFDDRPMTDRETGFVPGGAAMAALYEFQQPGLHA